MLLLRTARGAVPVVLRSYDARGDGLVHAVADIYGGTSAEGSGDREGPGKGSRLAALPRPELMRSRLSCGADVSWRVQTRQNRWPWPREPGGARGARGRGARGADFARGRGERGTSLRPSATPPTLSA